MAIAVGVTDELNDPSLVREPVEEGRRHDLVLECVIMPLSLIVLLVEAILGDVQHLPLSNIPSRACLWLAGVQ